MPSFDLSLYCRDCNVSCNSQAMLEAHNGGKGHRNITSTQVRTCVICQKTVPGGRIAWSQHIQESDHITLKAGIPNPLSYPYCNACRRPVSGDQQVNHCLTPAHIAKRKLAALAAAHIEAKRDRLSVGIIPAVLDLGVLEINHPSISLTGNLIVRALDKGFRLIACQFTSSVNQEGQDQQTSFFSTTATFPQLLIQSQSTSVPIRFTRQASLGHFSDTVELTFRSSSQALPFTIVRPVSARVGSANDFASLRPIGPYIRQSNRTSQQNQIDERLRAEDSGPTATIPYKIKLQSYDIPDGMVAVGTLEERIGLIGAQLPNEIATETYGKHWHTLLWVEEDQLRQDLKTYNLADVQLQREGRLYFLNVPGLAEKRPSVLRGDNVEIILNHRRGTLHLGRVESVQGSRVGLLFHRKFSDHWHTGALCEARFILNRLPFRRMHQALDIPFLPRRVLLPVLEDFAGIAPPTQEQMDEIQPFNPLLASNLPQLEAVTAILNQPSGSPPFIVFGPPGTGKTVTVVEAILQILRKNSNTRILACAPSNPAADIIALRLIENGLDTATLFRLNATSRVIASVPPPLQSYTYRDRHDRYSVSSLEDMNKFRIIVTTCNSASIPYNIKMAAGHFTHIVIDEAGQALEPECMIPIKTMGGPETNFILAGDPRQLGPIIRSEVVRPFEFAKSYLERMMDMDTYDEVDGHGISVVKLTRNWRNHEAILSFPNEEFYSGDLEVCAPDNIKDALLGSPVLANPEFPVVFHAVAGKDEQQAGSPSYFNIAEITQVVEYVEMLLADTARPTSPEEICIISPYNGQGKKLRQRLKEHYGGIKVGSVEMCQGEEYKVIIVTTVRTERQEIPFDLRHALGFLVNPQRLNVAITRAKALLIIVGDPGVLSLDPLWRRLLNYIFVSGGWKGIEPEWDPHNDDDDDDDDPNRYLNSRREERENRMGWTTQRLREAVMGAIGGGDGVGGLDHGLEATAAIPDAAWTGFGSEE